MGNLCGATRASDGCERAGFDQMFNSLDLWNFEFQTISKLKFGVGFLSWKKCAERYMKSGQAPQNPFEKIKDMAQQAPM